LEFIWQYTNFTPIWGRIKNLYYNKEKIQEINQFTEKKFPMLCHLLNLILIYNNILKKSNRESVEIAITTE
jgi:hypothetical protein